MKMAVNDLCSIDEFVFDTDIVLDPNVFHDMNSLPDIKDPLSPTGPPDRQCYKGQYNFSVEVNSSDVNKKKYLYSHALNRIYVDMECNFSIHFNWQNSAEHPAPLTMYVRATVVFWDTAQAEKRVERCLQHYHMNYKLPETYRSLSAGELSAVMKNVLHSSRPLGTAGVTYCGNPDAPDSWLSVVVELTKTGPQPVAHAYKFVCKNSCANGINRRSIAIIFTLENEHGQVYGREMVGARVCACPRRDILKDEAAEGVQKTPAGKRPLAPPPALTKKIKIEQTAGLGDPHEVITLPQLQVVGGRAMVTGLEVMLNMMQQSLDTTTNTALAATYLSYITKLRTDIEEIKNKMRIQL